MKKIVLVILLIVAVAAVGTIYAIPSVQELALINFKDKKFDEARAQYEVQLQQGNLSPDTAGNLVDLYLQNGRVNDAIGVMEQFIARRPNDLSARVILGQLYQYAQRQDDYLKNLEVIKAMHPSEEVLAKLHEAYQKDAQFTKQLSTLEALVQQGGQGGVMDGARYRSLATMQAQAREYDQAIMNLMKAREVEPQSFKFGEVELLVSLLADAKRPDDALKEANAYAPKPEATPQELARLGDVLQYKTTPQIALSFYGGIQNRVNEAPELTTGYVLALISAGQGEQAYALMQELHKSGKLPDGLQNEMLMQAIASGDTPTVLALFDNANAAQFNESQLITMTEMAAIRREQALMGKLKERFGGKETLEKFPLFAAVLGLAEKAPDADARIAQLKDMPLTHSQQLVVARACARAGKSACIDQMISQIGDPSTLSEQEVVDLAELYLLARSHAKGKAFVEQARAAKDSPALSMAWAKFAAATGDQAALQSWLDSNASASAADVKSLYFLANDNRQTATALMVAERLYAREQTDEVRAFLASAYVANKQYAKALPLFKAQAKRSAKDEENYFYVLVNLAKQNPKYKGELTDYAASRLNAKVPEKQRLAMVYTLIEAGRADVAMPFIKQYATRDGGQQWVSVYTDYLDKQGQTAEARDFRVKLAQNPKTSPLTKRQIAYTLLNQGYKEEATALFYELASRPDAIKADADQLMYLWGPRLSSEQAQWVAGKALASNAAQYDFWVERLVAQTGAEDMMAFVSANPDSLRDSRIARRYVQSLASLKKLDTARSQQAKGILNSGNEALLREFARTARGNADARPARQAYEQLASAAPQDPEALKGAGIIAFGQADYKASDAYLTSYLNSRGPNAPVDGETYLAYFYKAEILRKAGRNQEAKAYYQGCIDTVLAGPGRTAEMESKAYQSMIYSGNVENGVASFRELVAAHPENANLRADFASALIDAKRYDEARRVLREGAAMNPSAGFAPLHIPAGELQGYRFFSGGNELLISIRDPQLRRAMAQPNVARQFEWLGYVTEGEDRVLLVAQPGTELALAPTQDGYDIFPNASSQVAEDEVARQAKLRTELLLARIDVETGHAGSAVSRLDTLQPYYPQNAQLLGFTANAQNYAGRWKTALALLDEAQRQSPENQDIAKLRRDIWLAHAPNVKLDQEWVKIGDSNQHLTTLSGRADLGARTDISGFIQNDFIDADNIRRADGVIGDYSAVRQRAEVTVRQEMDGGLTPRASLYAGNNTLGGGVGLGFLSGIGESDIFLDYHRPTFDFVEGVFDDAYRDRVGFGHIYKPSTSTILSGVLAYNQYGVGGDENTLSSVSFAGQAIWQFIDSNPTLAAFYSLDLEYRLDENLYTDAIGEQYTKLPLDSREVHTVGLVTGYAFDETLYGRLLGGYSVDRIGGNGPVIEGRITKELFNDKLEAQFRAGYGMRTSNREGDVTRVGGYLMWRF